jgi:2'-5' RNA ligase
MRAFIAIDMPAPVLRQLTAAQRQLSQQLRVQQLDRCVRWTPAGNLHLTLRFLGEIDDVQQRMLAHSLAQIAARHARLTLFAGGMSCFPNTRRPSVIWCGLQGDLAALSRLQAEVEVAAQSAGLPAEAKPFTPHLTIGRLQRSATSAQLQAVGVTAHVAATPGRLEETTPTVDELLLMRSELTPSGSIYTRLGVFTLQAV